MSKNEMEKEFERLVGFEGTDKCSVCGEEYDECSVCGGEYDENINICLDCGYSFCEHCENMYDTEETYGDTGLCYACASRYY